MIAVVPLLASISLYILSTQAAIFRVTSTNLLPDINPGDGICRTADNKCSLRAAIDESNARPFVDQIILPAGKHPTNDNFQESGLTIRESVTIKGKSPFSSVITGNRKERHFQVTNEKLIVVQRDGNVAAVRPSSGRLLPPIAFRSPNARNPTAVYFTPSGHEMYVADLNYGIRHFFKQDHRFIINTKDKYTYEFSKLAVNGTTGNGAGPLTPFSMTIVRRFLLVVNIVGAQIRIYDRNTYEFKGTLSVTDAHSIVAHNGWVYVTMFQENQVVAIDVDTRREVRRSSKVLNFPRGIQICDDRIFVADDQNHRVVEFDKDLRFLRTIISDPGRLKAPSQIACFPHGEMFVHGSNKLLHYRFGATSSTFVKEVVVPNGTWAIASLNNVDNYGGPVVNIQRVTLRNGMSTGHLLGPSAMVQRGATLNYDLCHIRNNIGSSFGGAIFNIGTVTISRSRVFSNRMASLTNSVANSGGAIVNYGQLRVEYSELTKNRAYEGGAIWNFRGHLSVYQSTIAENVAIGGGGGILNFVKMDISYSTVTKNRCGSANMTGRAKPVLGCGIRSIKGISGGKIDFVLTTITASIIAENIQVGNFGVFAPDCQADKEWAVESFGSNILGAIDTTHCIVMGEKAKDRVGSKFSKVSPGLGRLKFYRVGGKRSATKGYEPQPGSLATTFDPYGGGENLFVPCPADDQIGRTRPKGSVCDVGSMERK